MLGCRLVEDSNVLHTLSISQGKSIDTPSVLHLFFIPLSEMVVSRIQLIQRVHTSISQQYLFKMISTAIGFQASHS